MKQRWRARLGYTLFGLTLGTSLPIGASVLAPSAVHDWIGLVGEALEHIETQFIGELEPGELAQGAIQGLVSKLDGHSAYYTPEEYQALVEQTEGRGVTVGEQVQVPTLIVQDLESNIRYVKLAVFTRGVSQEMREAVLRPTPAKSVILDLRNSPGGLFDEAVAMADIFLKEGIIVTARGRGNALLEERHAHGEATVSSIPLAVIVNEKSASSAEIFAAAVKDNHRARLFGETTYGKGSVQNMVGLSDGSGLKITVARYFTPNGENIEGRGIVPHTVLTSSAKQDAPLAAALHWLQRELQLD